MNYYLFCAGILCFILGLGHSILGEILIFKNKRRPKKIVPTVTTSYLKESHLRIIWATWHLASFFGWCVGAILIKITIAQIELRADIMQFITITVTITMLCSSFLVFIGSKGKHLGWIVLLFIGALTSLYFFK